MSKPLSKSEKAEMFKFFRSWKSLDANFELAMEAQYLADTDKTEEELHHFCQHLESFAMAIRHYQKRLAGRIANEKHLATESP